MEDFIIIKIYQNKINKIVDFDFLNQKYSDFILELSRFNFNRKKKLQIQVIPCYDLLKFYSLIEVEYNGELDEEEKTFYSQKISKFVKNSNKNYENIAKNSKNEDIYKELMSEDFELPVNIIFKKVEDYIIK